ncbi:S-layer homology domain-containing protein [Bacillus sp. FJAT-29790]|uniref:S-layer homology domain-containing protein n=1 Tax=Bacillus sp. FJAT-29790 TaxID=1895002 RepID=UPI001C23CCF2|nr:S-layer homology domain-containing protein [Bacillus sp. FJAT-29790]MBU8881137.1 S-layer homology domain-containing protein [Bacillus sp. FJAT-29790]
MNRVFPVLLVLALVFSFGNSMRTQAASPTDWWTEQDAKVSPYVYSLLLDRAGFAAYIYTDTKISMNPQNLSNFTIEERFENFFIGRFYNDSNKVLVTKDGLIVSYMPKEIAHTIIPNQNFLDVQSAVKSFVGPTISKTNYINFSSLESNKAIVFYGGYKAKMLIPSESKINDIGLAMVYGNSFGRSRYGTIVPGSLQPGVTHSISTSVYGEKGNGVRNYIDDVQVYDNRANMMSVFYTSNSSIDVQGMEDYKKYDLTNKFLPVISDVSSNYWAYDDIKWAVLQGMIRGYENGSFKPENTLTESQFVSLLSKYYEINTSLDGKSSTYNEDGAYIYLKKYNLPLKGYANKAERMKPVSRGVVAQAFSITQGGPKDLNGAVQFLYTHDISTGRNGVKTVESYGASENLTRSQISAFFKRMNTAKLTEIQ